MKRNFVLSMIMLYLVGIVIQFLYVPYIARLGPSLQFAHHEANYSWRWNAPMYFDIEKMENIYQVEAEEWKKNPFRKFDPQSTWPFGSHWVKIYGIDYNRVLMTFVAWTILMGGLWFASKHYFKTE